MRPNTCCSYSEEVRFCVNGASGRVSASWVYRLIMQDWLQCVVKGEAGANERQETCTMVSGQSV